MKLGGVCVVTLPTQGDRVPGVRPGRLRLRHGPSPTVKHGRSPKGWSDLQVHVGPSQEVYMSDSSTPVSPVQDPTICTPDQRLLVFISPTLREPAPERGAA